ncbi:Aldo/keto reductase [Gymnopus androsaceus JB14]|uniref:Aldo/keto reductase n=1 Tax=Gymnopus androsaceus JB14 TaxID=1447944 RepID=A0A6A4GJK2_9AGAR|nr:Aldo/keto reductase [Gymnopus androsaceus JB14]
MPVQRPVLCVMKIEITPVQYPALRVTEIIFVRVQYHCWVDSYWYIQNTAQAYQNETEIGQGILQSGLPRDNIFIMTKFSGLGGLGIRESVKDSLNKLGVSYIDLYLIHHPRFDDIPSLWKEIEDIQEEGLTRSIGVSNFAPEHLDLLLASAKVVPAANQASVQPILSDDEPCTPKVQKNPLE